MLAGFPFVPDRQNASPAFCDWDLPPEISSRLATGSRCAICALARLPCCEWQSHDLPIRFHALRRPQFKKGCRVSTIIFGIFPRKSVSISGTRTSVRQISFRSAGLHPAVSRISNPQAFRNGADRSHCHAPPIANRRYGRLENLRYGENGPLPTGTKEKRRLPSPLLSAKLPASMNKRFFITTAIDLRQRPAASRPCLTIMPSAAAIRFPNRAG